MAITYFFKSYNKLGLQIIMLKGIKGEINLSLEQGIVGATGFLSLFSLVGIMFYGLPFFYDFWVKDFGFSRAKVTSGYAFGGVMVGLFGFIAGWLIDRFGPRRLMLSGILLGGISLIALSRMDSLWQFYLFNLMGSIGYICGGPLPNQVLTSRWFDQSRGKAMSIAYLGIGFGGMLVPQMAKWLTLKFGWREALMTLGILLIAVAFPMAWFVHDNPKGSLQAAIRKEPTYRLGNILNSRAFYLLLIGSMCSTGAVSSTSQHLKLFLSADLKYSQTMAANVISLVLSASIIGRLLMGWLADRMPKKFVMILIYTLVAASISLLFIVSLPGVIYLFTLIFGIALGGEYMIIPLMAAELFGVKVMGRVMGIILTADGLAIALAPMLIGWLRDRSGTYDSGFVVLILLGAIGTIAVLLLPHKTNIQ